MASHQYERLRACSICKEQYSLRGRVPKILQCGDTFCNICLRKMEDNRNITCPNCKVQQTLTAKGVDGLYTNRIATELLNVVRQSFHSNIQTIGKMYDIKSVDDIVHNVEQIRNDAERKLPHIINSFLTNAAKSDVFCKQAKGATHVGLHSDEVSRLERQANEYIKTFERFVLLSDELTSISGQLPDKYDIKPKVIFGSRGSGDGEFMDPRAVVIVHGNLYVADDGNKRICVYDKKGHHISSYDIGEAPCDLAVTNNGQLVITRYTPDDPLLFYDMSGTITKMGKWGNGRDEWNYPRGITSDSSGLLYVCDTENDRIKVLDQTGNVIRIMADTGAGRLTQPRSVAIQSHSGDIYVVGQDINDNKSKVNIYSHDGVYKSSITQDNIPQFSPSMQSISLSHDGVLCISDIMKHCLHILKDGVYLQQLGSYGDAPGEFQWPFGTIFTDTGDLVVCDHLNDRIQIFALI